MRVKLCDDFGKIWTLSKEQINSLFQEVVGNELPKELMLEGIRIWARHNLQNWKEKELEGCLSNE
jgi:hypothetical protein